MVVPCLGCSKLLLTTFVTHLSFKIPYSHSQPKKHSGTFDLAFEVAYTSQSPCVVGIHAHLALKVYMITGSRVKVFKVVQATFVTYLSFKPAYSHCHPKKHSGTFI